MQNHGYGMGMPAVKAVNFVKVDIGSDIPVNDHKGAIIPEILDIFDGASGSQYVRFKTALNGNRIAAARNPCFDLMMQVMGIEHDGLASCPNQTLDGPVKKRYPADGKEGLGNPPGVRKQARSQSGT